jgi:phospholipid/cholesterol/gamma-HCH transport system ATP-binding protein
MISDYQKQFGFTGIIVSHEIPDIFFISQRIAMLENGEILFEGSPEEIQKETNPIIQQFLRGLDSSRDDLTGVFTQTQGEDSFSKEMARLKRHNISFSLVLLTVENLDEIVTKLGVQVGHNALKTFANQVQKHLRITDTCSRYGMNSILLVLHYTNVDQAQMVCNKLSHELKEIHYNGLKPDKNFCFLVRVGFAEAEEDSRLEEVIAEAESRQSVKYEFKIC